MRVLLIFIRNPEYGKVKSRLAAALGDDEALQIYLHLLEKTRQMTLECRAERWLFYSDVIQENDAWEADFFRKMQQDQTPDLGRRMQSAFETAFEAGAEKALIIGSDCPDLSAEILEKAFQALDTNDAVLGPASDGGYYLLGLKTMDPALFRDITWSTDTVLQKTLEKLENQSKKYTLLPVLSDIDTERDWQEYQNKR